MTVQDSIRFMIHIGDSLNNHAKFDSAITLFNQAFKKAEKHQDRESMIYSHIQLSETYGDLADFTTAEDHANQALQFSIQFQLDSLWIESKKSILTLQFQQGKYQDALDIAEEVLDKRTLLFGANHFDVAMDYNDIGVLSYMLGDYSNATDAYARAFDIIQAEDKNINLRAQLLNNMGVAFARLGNYLDALDHYSRSLDLKKQYLDDDHPSFGTNLRNIGMIYSRIGEYHHGLEFYELALINWKNYYGESHPKVGELYQDISVTQMYLGNYHDALQLQTESLEILKRKLDPSHPKIALGNSNLSMIYMGLKMYDEAEKHNLASIEQEIKQFGEDYPHLAINYSNLGTVYSETGKFDLAKENLYKALSLRISQYGEDHYRTAIIYGKIGSMYFRADDYPSAKENQLKALEIAQSFWGEYHHRTGEFYIRLGRLYSKINDHKKALNYYHKNVICQSINFTDTSYFAHPDLIPSSKNYQLLNALSHKANEMVVASEDPSLSQPDKKKLREKALEVFEHSIDLLNTIRKGFYLSSSKLVLNELHNTVFSPAINIAYTLYNQTDNIEFLHRAFRLSEQERATVFWDNIQSINAREFSGIPDSLIQKEKSIRTEISFFENMVSKTLNAKDDSTQKVHHSWKSKLFTSTEAYKHLLSQLDTNYPEYYSLKFNAPLADVKTIQNSLDRKTALIEYSVSDTILYIFVLTNKKLSCKTVLIDSSLSDLIQTYLKSVIKLNTSDFIHSARMLYTILIEPIKSDIRFKNKLVIIPHEELYELPFDALLTKEHSGRDITDYPYLISKYDIIQHYSANLLVYTKNIPDNRANNHFIGFAPVKFENMFDNLPGSVEEIQTISSLFNDKNKSSTSCLYQDANERIIKSSELKEYKYIHLATHGVVKSENNDQSYFVFSQDDSTKSSEDNLLYANECYNLDLQSDLVVLSSCESGLGEIAKGEGIMGLNRGFQYSGTKNIVYSLWKVDDKSSHQLMSEMYQLIVRNGAQSSSLRKAKLAMIKNPATAFPKAWAGYVWMGE